jgi:hypothetical protein
MTRQREWQIKKNKEGLCAQCGQGKLNLYSNHCDECAKRKRELTREARGHQDGAKSGLGRPLLVNAPDWSKVNWMETDGAIAKSLGVTVQAVRPQRAKRA